MAGYSNDENLDRKQVQFMLGGMYELKKGVFLCLGVIGGKYVASPRIGGQIGLDVDFPEVLQKLLPGKQPLTTR